MEEKIVLAEKLPELYSELKPALIGIAYKYKVPNPSEFADEWLSKAYMIVDKFDRGDLKKKVYLSHEGGINLAEYDQEIHSEKHLLKSLKAYLKKSFVNDLIKQYHKRKRYQDFSNSVYQMRDEANYSTIDSLLHLNPAYIEDINSLLTIDLSRLAKNTTSVLDMVNRIFLKALFEYCDGIKSKYGNIMVVKDLDTEDNKRFFSEDFRSDLEQGVRLKLCDVILEDTNPVLIKKLSYLIDLSKRGTLQKRIFRYFFEYHNGYPKRLRDRVNSKTLR